MKLWSLFASESKKQQSTCSFIVITKVSKSLLSKNVYTYRPDLFVACSWAGLGQQSINKVSIQVQVGYLCAYLFIYLYVVNS